ncbi:DUF2628 domain-containing protein [Orbus mooreae]|uniref:DUF2628 domain-containing protein n=1 Tax=Orbus mooreae TaxID=3074107 RepID=UPI00370DD009
MKNYKIFKHQDGRIEAVKQGWSWPGFFFGIIWALIKKLWTVAGALVLVMIVFGIISYALLPDPSNYNNYYELQQAMSTFEIWDNMSTVISLVIAIVIGVKGNDFREKNLLSKGYTLQCTVFAANPDMAILEARKAEENNKEAPANNSHNDINQNNGSSNIVV